MGLLSTTDSPAARRVLFVVGGLLLAAGLLLGLLDTDENTDRSRESAVAHVSAIDRHLDREDAEDGTPTEIDRLRERIDFSSAPEPRPERVEGEDFELFVNTTGEYLVWLFDAIGYTGEKVAAGETTAIPPLIIVSIPAGWAEDVSVQLKKSIFYRVMLPLILLENDAVLAQREILEAYRQKLRNRAPITPEEHAQARELAVEYKVLDKGDPGALDAAALDELLLRVDMVPPSLALGQAAYESGYATSRFAHTGNALFGQWDWSEDAIKPEQQRSGMGNYGIKAFPYPVDSVRAYLWNLNTHRSYADFRKARAAQRDGRRGRVPLDGHALAGTLLSYSERGKEYTDDLQGMISYNKLTIADDLRLLEGEPIYYD